MKKITLSIMIVMVVMLASGSVAALAIDRQIQNAKSLNGSEDYRSDSPSIPLLSPVLSPGTQIGRTYYDMQHNSTMGRQVGYSIPDRVVHFVWMRRNSAGGDRKVVYNSYNRNTYVYAYGTGPGAGKAISGINGGFPTLDVTTSIAPVPGAAAVTFHEGASASMYATHGAIDQSPPTGSFTFNTGAPGPLTCEGWVTGSEEYDNTYIWPVVAYQDSGATPQLHVVSCEAPAVDGLRTLVYYRNFGGEDNTWPSCGRAIDSIYNVNPVVRVDPISSGKVAIVWLHPIYYEDDPYDPCGNHFYQNDVVYIESDDYGMNWPLSGTYTNITDYAAIGPIDQQPNGLAYGEVSALYDTQGNLHVVWNTALRDVSGGEPCTPLPTAKVWHWDKNSDAISLVYDASLPNLNLYMSGWDLAACKLNISECNENLYVSFTRFGATTTPDGMTNADNSVYGWPNGDILITGSPDGGQTWSEAMNATESSSNGCAPGDCESDHWATMAMYNKDTLQLVYVNDRDAGAFVLGYGDETENPVMHLEYPCFEPEVPVEECNAPASFDLQGKLFDNSPALIDVGLFAVQDFVDIDDDGDLDLFIGDYDGEVWYYRNDGDAQNYSFTFVSETYASIDVDRAAAPSFVDIDNDGDYDLFIGENLTVAFGAGPGHLYFYENTGSESSPSFSLLSSDYVPLTNSGLGKPDFVDIDNDGDLDMFLAWEDEKGTPNQSDDEWGLAHFRNDGSSFNPAWTLITQSYAGISGIGNAGWLAIYSVEFSDIDCDGDFDLIYGDEWTKMNYYRNDGTDLLASWTFITDDFMLVNSSLLGEGHVPELADLDGDGLDELTIGTGIAANDDDEGIIQVFGASAAIKGDADGSGGVDIDDVVSMISCIFLGGDCPSLAVGDVNCDGQFDIDDVVYLINYIFSGGPPPGDPDDDGIPDC